MSEGITARLLGQLRARGVIPLEADCTLEPRRARRPGDWKWQARWSEPHKPGQMAGSAWSMTDCASAASWTMVSFWSARERMQATVIVPDVQVPG